VTANRAAAEGGGNGSEIEQQEIVALALRLRKLVDQDSEAKLLRRDEQEEQRPLGIGEGRGIDALVELYMAHGADAIAQTRGGFVVERRRRLVHLLDQAVLHCAALAG